MSEAIDRYFEENKAAAGLGRAALKSGAFMMAARLVNVVIQVGSAIVLARLLDPHEVGLAAMVLAITAFAPLLVDLGTTDAIAQKPQITRQEVSTLFWLNLTVGTGLTLALAAASSFIASSLNQPALLNVALVSSLSFVLSSLFIQHYALMRRAMEFQRVVLIDLFANLISSILIIVLAFYGWSYWSLVVKPLLLMVLTAAGAWTSVRWVPGRPVFNDDVKKLMRFGLGITGFTLSDQLTRSADKIAVGYFYGPGQLGYFQNSSLLYAHAINVLAESLHNVAISGLSKFKDDAEGLRRSWGQALSLVTFISTAAFAVLAATGQDVVALLLGEKWAPAGVLLSLFGIRGIAQCVERTMGWLHVVAGRTDRWMRWGLFSTVCQLTALAAGLPFGANGVAVAYAITMFLIFLPAIAYAGKPLGIGYKDAAANTLPQIVSAIFAASGGYLFLLWLSPGHLHIVRIILASFVCMSIYLIVAVGFFRVTEPLRLAYGLLMDLVAKRTKNAS